MDDWSELIVSKSYAFGLFKKQAYIEYRLRGIFKTLKLRYYILWFIPVYSHDEKL